MFQSRIDRDGDGQTAIFSFPFPYLERSHIYVDVNGVEQAFSFAAPSIIALPEPPEEGSTVTIKRRTPSEAIVDFADGASLTEIDLDTANLQSIYLNQEAADRMLAIEQAPDANVELASLDDLLAIYLTTIGGTPEELPDTGEYDFLAAYQG